MTNRFIPSSGDSRTLILEQRISETAGNNLYNNFGTAQPVGPANGYQQRFVASSRLPVDGVFFQVGVDCAAYRRIEVGGAKAIE